MRATARERETDDRSCLCVAVAGGCGCDVIKLTLAFCFLSFLGWACRPRERARHLRRLEPSSFVLRSGLAVVGWFLAPFWIGWVLRLTGGAPT